MSGLVWVASYPKSGNTWFRALLSNLLSGREPVALNALRGTLAAERTFLDPLLGVEAADLTETELAAARPAAYASLGMRTTGLHILKTHDRYDDAPPSVLLEGTCAVMYLVRHPFDVAVSWAHFTDRSLDQATQNLRDTAFTLTRVSSKIRVAVPQRLGSWATNVESWLRAPLPVHVVRYEDLLAAPEATFAAAATAIGLSPSPDAVADAVARSRFDTLKAQEEVHGFREQPRSAERFFRSGRAGEGRMVLSTEQQAHLAAAFRPTMDRLGYHEDGTVGPAPALIRRTIPSPGA